MVDLFESGLAIAVFMLQDRREGEAIGGSDGLDGWQCLRGTKSSLVLFINSKDDILYYLNGEYKGRGCSYVGQRDCDGALTMIMARKYSLTLR